MTRARNHADRPGHRPMLLVGLPRSGTTWVARSLESAGSVDLVLEPDNEGFHPLAYGYKRSHRFPASTDYAVSGLPTVFDRAARGWCGDPRTRLLMKAIGRRRWQLEDWIGTQCGDAGYGHPPTGCRQSDPDAGRHPLVRACRSVMPVIGRPRRRRLIKTVHAVRTVEPIVEQIDADVILVVRNPFAVVASLSRRIPLSNWPEPQANADRYRGLPACRIEAEPHTQVARQCAYLLGHLARLSAAHPTWTLVAHDQLCRAPADELPDLADRLGLGSADRVRQAVIANDRPGAGYETRRPSREQIDAWKQELTDDQIAVIGAEVQSGGLWPFLESIGATGDR
ncbi:MAG: sulfotransferase [Acidimicrobiia bacterium]|nr:sulfotransferase [Acidimicrobiia bacterium]